MSDNTTTTNETTTRTKGESMTITEMRDETYEAYKAGLVTLEEAAAIEAYLKKREYNAERNKRPEVRAARKAYNERKAAERKEGKLMLQVLLANKK